VEQLVAQTAPVAVEAVLAPPAPTAEPVPAAAPAPAPAPAPPVQQVADVKQQAIPSIERALSGPARDLNASWGGKVKVVTGNGAGLGPGARDQEAQDRNRARLPVAQPSRILILGCTSGAGQSVTALMTASMLASLREQPVAAVDLHDGTLARYRAPAAWLEELLAGQPPQQIRPARPDGLHPTPKPSPARLDVVASHEPLKDGDEIKLAVQLNRHYPLTLLDPGAATLTRLLKVTDQLVVVVPANVDAAGALADTRDWLDNNGHAELAMQSVTVINGVSRRSLPDVESAESIARGRSRAIVRVPWDDMLPVAAANPSTLRPQTRVAYTALSGVLVAGLAATPVRKKP
jgi:MinD-like ATPase involved in chromosome partitioning or flagellar assembly